jgi:putative membrane protein
MNRILLMLKGAAMGMAEVVPGVSGGTIAFITGIYEELLRTIKGIKPSLISTWRKKGFAEFWEELNGNFILLLGSGMVVGLIFFVFFISHFLENNPEILLAFFFGLILASSVYIWRQVTDKSMKQLMIFAFGVVVAFILTIVNPGAGSTSLVYIFFCGMIAISALILPGISGSFIMLLLGMYSTIIFNVRNFLTSFDLESFIVILVFGSGCLIGIFSFARVLSYAFDHYKNQT